MIINLKNDSHVKVVFLKDLSSNLGMIRRKCKTSKEEQIFQRIDLAVDVVLRNDMSLRFLKLDSLSSAGNSNQTLSGWLGATENSNFWLADVDQMYVFFGASVLKRVSNGVSVEKAFDDVTGGLGDMWIKDGLWKGKYFYSIKSCWSFKFLDEHHGALLILKPEA